MRQGDDKMCALTGFQLLGQAPGRRHGVADREQVGHLAVEAVREVAAPKEADQSDHHVSDADHCGPAAGQGFSAGFEIGAENGERRKFAQSGQVAQAVVELVVSCRHGLVSHEVHGPDVRFTTIE